MLTKWILLLALVLPPGYEIISQFDRPCRIPSARLPWKVGTAWRGDLLEQAVRIWNEAGYGTLFAIEPDLTRCDVVVDWSGAGLPPDKASATWWDAGLGWKRVLGITLDGRLPLPEGNHVQLLTHELGHALGLDHSAVDEDIMAERMHRRRYRSAPPLTARDVEALGWLLGQEDWVPIKGALEP